MSKQYVTPLCSVERSRYSQEMVLEGQMEVKELFEFVTNNAEAMDAYSMEQSIFSRIMDIGLSAMKGYLP